MTIKFPWFMRLFQSIRDHTYMLSSAINKRPYKYAKQQKGINDKLGQEYFKSASFKIAAIPMLAQWC